MAGGRQRSGSDVDVLIVGDAGFREVVAVLAESQTQVGREINPTVYPPQEFCAKLSARHHFLEDVLEQEKIFLIGDQRDLEGLAQQRLVD